MKLTIAREDLVAVVGFAARGLPSRPPAPVLLGLKLDAADGQLGVSGFDYEVSAHATVPAQVADPGTALVSGRLLADIARAVPGDVDLSTDDTRAVLVSGQARFTLLDILIGPEHTEAFLTQRAKAVTSQDGIAPDRAVAWVRQRAADGDLLILATPGQTWHLRPDVDEDDAPALELTITDRLACPPRVRVIGRDDGVEDELLIEVLEMYWLKEWEWTT